jgi:Helix-turn-helix domain
MPRREPPELRFSNEPLGEDRLLTTVKAAGLLAIAPATLRWWRNWADYGPDFIKVGRAVRYRVEDLRAWLRKQTMRPGRGKP